MATFPCLLLAIFWFVSKTLSSSDNSSKDNLVFTHVLYRHGDRAPGKLYPNDPYGMEPWPQGLEELSMKGMMQHYQLGKYLRKRYSKLLSKRYVHEEIYVRASDKNRALQSAASYLAGFYPPVKDQAWNSKLDWQPIPIHSVPTSDDHLLVVDNPCPKYGQVYANQTKAIIDSYNNRYKDFFTYVRNNSGLKKLDFSSIGDIYDPLYCESAQGLKLPQWAQAVVNETTGQTAFELIVDLKTINKNLKYDSDEKALLTGGFLLGDILTRLKSVAAGVNSTKVLNASKMIMYSAHDDTVMALLYAMNVIERPFLVPYAAAVLIDLHQTKEGRYFVEVTYKNNTPPCKGKHCEPDDSDLDDSSEESDQESSGMIHFVIPGCPGSMCPLETVLSSLSGRTTFPEEKRNRDCGIKETPDLLRQSVIKDDHASD